MGPIFPFAEEVVWSLKHMKVHCSQLFFFLSYILSDILTPGVNSDSHINLICAALSPCDLQVLSCEEWSTVPTRACNAK